MGFKQYLDSLRLSSKEAIVDGVKDSLSDLKKYLHIERTVETDLSKMILKVEDVKNSQLILLLGNVGDGKSHLLAKMWDMHPSQMQMLNVHNDATESTYKNKSYLENLLIVFNPYSDENLERADLKVDTIIAINLGTITNFLEEVGAGFSKLRSFVEENHLIDQQINLKQNTENDHFQSLNLTDYHIFSLEESRAKCQVLLDILNRITRKADDNPFYSVYKDYYTNHPRPDNCPIKYNYDLLSKENVQSTLSELLVKVIVSDKLIVSVRLLMNWIYDLIVPPEFSNLSDEEILNRTKQPFNSQKFYKNTLPVLLFDSPGTSPLLRYINQYDPTNITEQQDEIVIKLGTVSDAREYFIKYNLLKETDSLYYTIENLNVENRIQLFLRLHYIFRFNDLLKINDVVFADYITCLYNFNSGNTSRLITLYEQVQNSIYQWNGTTESKSNHINLNIGQKQSIYNISQKLELDYAPIQIAESKLRILEKFSKTLRVSFKVHSESQVFNLEIDYKLYQLIININNGYRPNRIDKRIHVKFTQFVDELIKHKSHTRELIIQQFNGESQKKFKLSFINGFDAFQFIEI